MKIPSIDKRTKEDLIKYIKDVAPYYAPQWRFDTEDLDMGSILALIFTDMFHGTIERLNKVPYKNFLTFLNTINANLYPSISAKGYITLKLVGGIDEGVLVKRGEKLSASKDGAERVIFETLKDIYVTPADVDYVYNTSFKNDTIINSYEKKEDEKETEIILFNTEGENLQNHELYIKHKELLNISGKGKIKIYVEMNNNECELDIRKLLTNLNFVKWSYVINNKSITFDKVIENDKCIQISKDFVNEQNDDIEESKDAMGIIKCEISNIHKFEELNINKILLASEAENIIPDRIFSNDIEQEEKEFFPFSERFSVYNDLYIGCNEAFLKAESDITLTFELEFDKIPIETLNVENEFDWKLIMKKSNFKKEQEYEISVSEVMWEYWNGKGWARLYLDKDYSKLFNSTNDFQRKNIIIKFNCPKDIEQTVVNSYEGCFIRIRVLRVNNAYMNKGWYISPVMNKVRIAYKYTSPILPDEIGSTNNMVSKIYKKEHINDENQKLSIIKKLGMQNNVAYFAFTKKPEGVPIKILFSLASILPYGIPVLVWEYYSEDGWKTLTIVDETDNMRKSGIVSFLGEKDFMKKILFNKDMYWIRIYNPNGNYEKNQQVLPIIKGIYVNSTQIIQNDTQNEEMFYIEAYEKNKKCKLTRDNINNIEVWINEYGKISEEDICNYNKDDIEIVNNSSGEHEAVWVRWKEVNDFITSNCIERHYICDRNDGTIDFGDDVNGKIPIAQNRQSIKIYYSIGGGEIGNIPPREIQNMTKSLGYINKIFNPLATSGGSDMEVINESLERSPNILQHRGRAITATDYENLAIESSRNIIKAKCFSGLNTNGEKEPGTVTLVILQKGNFADDLYFSGLKEEVDLYLKMRNVNMLNKKRQFNIISPYFIEIVVKVDVETSDLDYVFSVKQDIQDAINKFIDPIRGNFNEKGWEIGELPERTQILNCLKNIKNIKRINNIILYSSINYEGIQQDIDIEVTSKKIYAIPLNGKHKINVSVK